MDVTALIAQGMAQPLEIPLNVESLNLEFCHFGCITQNTLHNNQGCNEIPIPFQKQANLLSTPYRTQPERPRCPRQTSGNHR
jgi:hypothetical protein